MRFGAVFLFVAVLVAPAGAQGPPAYDAERDAVVAAVQAFFDTMATKDVEGARRVLTADGRFYSARDVDGKTAIRVSSFEAYLTGLPAGKSAARERMWNPEVRVRGHIASVWTPYDFWTDGKFSHCGIDDFALIKTEEGWKIAGGTYTVETRGCEPSPLGPLK